MDRRDLLKFFSIGTTITPVLNGTPIVKAAAELLAVPNLKPVAAAAFPGGHAPEHFRERLKWNPFEAIWLGFWQIENNPPSWLNYGIGPLEHVLRREPTEAEKAAVSALIQWFGSNCGHAFIEETLRACGYRVTFEGDKPHGKYPSAIQAIQHHNVWPGVPAPPEVRIARRGRTVVLRPGQEPEVTSD